MLCEPEFFLLVNEDSVLRALIEVHNFKIPGLQWEMSDLLGRRQLLIAPSDIVPVH